MPSDTATPTIPQPQTVSVAVAFEQLLAAMKAECLDASGDDFDRLNSYRRTIERQAQRYADGLPLTERAAKGG